MCKPYIHVGGKPVQLLFRIRAEEQTSHIWMITVDYSVLEDHC